MNSMNMHRIAKIELDETTCLNSKKRKGIEMGHSRHLTITNGDGEEFRITLFSDDTDALIVKASM